jgi:hypothetical protein
MKFHNRHCGRLGNAIFRYLASVIYTFYYDATITWDGSTISDDINDDQYIEWMNSIMQGILPPLRQDATYFLTGYYQHDALIKKHKAQIIEYIKAHPEDRLYDHFGVIYHLSRDIIMLDNPCKKYDIALHLRLEDFVGIGMIMQPKCISDVLDQIRAKWGSGDSKVALVLNAPTTEFENKYVDYFRKLYGDWLVVESNDVVTDYHILKNARVLVSSMSTLCWIAALMSDTLEELYFPDYKRIEGYGWGHQTVYKPIENTIHYGVEYTREDGIQL